jgi:site-specific DNA recombinase
MTTAAIYCRVSTETQEVDGTSLETQLEECRNYCKSKNYRVIREYQEIKSGLTLDRPILNKVRELIRNGEVERVVVFALDRLTRDPRQGVHLFEELEDHNAKLKTVTDVVENADADIGWFINYARGLASKLEAKHIKERTIRGKKAKASMGFMSSGGHTRTYGYDYTRPDRKKTGRRVANEMEAGWVRKMFDWYVSDGLTTRAIATYLNELKVPTKSGASGVQWSKSQIKATLSNRSYLGETIEYGHDIPGLTEPIVDLDTFEAAQQQLQINRQRASRNAKHRYLLGGHVRCKKCGRSLWGYSSGREPRHYYKCATNWSSTNTPEKCCNRSWPINELESLVWDNINIALMDPEIIISEIEKDRKNGENPQVVEDEIKRVIRQIQSVEKDQGKLIRLALKDFPDEVVEIESRKLSDQRAASIKEKSALEQRLIKCREAVINRPTAERFIGVLRQKIVDLDFDGKRLALQALDIKVWVDGNQVEITGSLPVEKVVALSSIKQFPLPRRGEAG